VKLRRSQAPPPAILFVIPAIQIPLLLLFFFLVGSTFLLQPGISVAVPSSPFILTPRSEPLVISVPPPPSTQFFFDGHPTDLPGLRNQMAGLRGRARTVVIRAGRTTPYERVVEVVNTSLELGFSTVLATSRDPGAR
jgi:biopolymer transport protein ExbD